MRYMGYMKYNNETQWVTFNKIPVKIQLLPFRKLLLKLSYVASPPSWSLLPQL